MLGVWLVDWGLSVRCVASKQKAVPAFGTSEQTVVGEGGGE